MNVSLSVRYLERSEVYMRIFEFIDKYCQDLVEANNASRQLVDLSEFPHDDVITDLEGKKIPIVIAEGHEIPINDFFTSTRDDFMRMWQFPSAGQVYDNYNEALEILEGEDVIDHVRKVMAQERERLSTQVSLCPEVF